MAKKKKQEPKPRCPLCQNIVSAKKARNLESAKVVKVGLVLYKTGELGRYIADVGISAPDIIECEEEE